MPKFELVPLQDAVAKTATGKRAQITQEYLGYLNQVDGGQAGKLRASQEESAIAIRRRLGAAAKLAGKDLIIKRSGDDVFFWVQARRRGRPRKTTTIT